MTVNGPPGQGTADAGAVKTAAFAEVSHRPAAEESAMTRTLIVPGSAWLRSRRICLPQRVAISCSYETIGYTQVRVMGRVAIPGSGG